MNVGLPAAPKRLSPLPVHTRVAHNDTYSKGKMAEYANARRHTTHSEMTPGDYVLVKKPKKNTLTTPYNATPCLVKEKKGSMITARRRRLPPHITTPSDVTESDAPESETPPPDTNVSEDVVHAETSSTENAGDINTSSNQLRSPSDRHSGRETKTPTHLKDCVLN